MKNIFGTDKHFNWRNFTTAYLVSLGCIAFGYPASIISVTLGTPAFLEYMGLVDPKTGVSTSRENSVIGTTNGVFQAGAFVNTFITAWLLERFGRKNTMYYNAVVGLFGGALLTGSRNISMFIAGRWFTGMSSWGFLIATPVFTAELSPPDLRGFYTGLIGVHIGMGYFLAAAMGRAFAEYADPIARWRAPLGIYLMWPTIIIIAMLFSPESPRYLLLKGKVEEARAVIFKMHTVKGDDTWACEEFEQMQRQTEIDKTLETSWISMFRKPSYRKRTLICMFYCFCGQSTAVLVINNYGPTFYKALGYDTIQQLNFQVAWVSLAPPFCLLGALLLDRVGRKFLLMWGIGGCCICLCIEAASVATFVGHTNRKGVGKLGVAALFLFNACYNVGVDVGGNVFYAEVFPNHIRDKGVALTNAVLALADLVYLEVTPTAFANIGYKWFLVFICISAVGFVILYFILPETKGIPLEEMGKLFGDLNETAMYSEPTATFAEKAHNAETGAARSNDNEQKVDVADDKHSLSGSKGDEERYEHVERVR